MIVENGEDYASLNELISARTELSLLKFTEAQQILDLIRERQNGEISIVLISEDKINPSLNSLAEAGLIVLLVVCDK